MKGERSSSTRFVHPTEQRRGDDRVDGVAVLGELRQADGGLDVVEVDVGGAFGPGAEDLHC